MRHVVQHPSDVRPELGGLCVEIEPEHRPSDHPERQTAHLLVEVKLSGPLEARRSLVGDRGHMTRKAGDMLLR